jgi:hypothetical protein
MEIFKGLRICSILVNRVFHVDHNRKFSVQPIEQIFTDPGINAQIGKLKFVLA